MTWINVLLKSIGILVISFVGVRIMGKRQLAKITPFQLITYIVIAILAAMVSTNMITDPEVIFASLTVWILIPLGMDYLAMKSKWFYTFFHGKETILIKGGEIMENNLKHIRLTGDELLSELRNRNVFNLADVEFAIMEPSGEMNILFKNSKKVNNNHEVSKKVDISKHEGTFDKIKLNPDANFILRRMGPPEL